MPAFLAAGISALGAWMLGAGAGLAGAAVMFYATEIATAVILAGGLAYSSSQKSKAARAARGTKLVVIDPRRTESCEGADLHLALRPGSDVALILAIANGSPDVNDRLVGITSDVGEVTLTGSTAVPANGVLAVGVPDGVTELSSVEAANGADASVALTKPIRNGLTYNFTFTFEKAGQKTLAVPISAGNAPRQEG